ncbi:MAG: radical SAM protein [Polyangiales bacterium]
MTKALLVVPPFLKHATGPLLGPAMLAGAAMRAGHDARVVDLNALWIARDVGAARWSPNAFVGDHERDERLLQHSQQRFHAVTHDAARRLRAAPDALVALRTDHSMVVRAAAHLGDAQGAWLANHLVHLDRPEIVGVSVLFAGQVLWALAVTRIARTLWPGTPVVWGGAHVTALAPEVARDVRYAAAADGFVAGYAERTFVDLLDAMATGRPWLRECFRAGQGHAPRAIDDGSVAPHFEMGPRPMDAPLTLPAQYTRGCVYGRCRYCTYPAIEGTYRPLEATPSSLVVAEAERRAARVSFKDSLLAAPLLRELAVSIEGRVRWSACTKLSRALDASMLRMLAQNGCATLELGLETLDERAQRMILKRQSPALFLDTLDAAAAAGIAVVVNYMTGFPGVDPVDEQRGLDQLAREIEQRPELTVKVEHNRFELERRAPLARTPPAGLRITGAWPWSSVLDWTCTRIESRRRLEVVS